MTVFRIFIFCFRLAGEAASSLPCCLALFKVISFCRFHLREGINWIPKYVYDSFCVRIGNCLDL